MNIHWWADIAQMVIALEVLCRVCNWVFPRIYRWMMKPQIICKHLDSPLLKDDAAAAIKVGYKSYSIFSIAIGGRWWLPFTPEYQKQNIKLKLKAPDSKKSDFAVYVTELANAVGETLEVRTEQDDVDDHKIVAFAIEPHVLHRIIIKGLALDEFEMDIELEECDKN